MIPAVRWLQDVGRADVGLVGGKNASLGELMRALHLEVAQANRSARRLYEHAGFRVRERYCLMMKRLIT